MKHLTFSILLFLILLLTCAGSIFYVTVHVSQTEQLLEHAVQLYEADRREDAAAVIQEASDCWEQCEKPLGILLQHDEIDHVNGEFARLLAYVESEDQDDFRSSSAALLSDLAHIREMEQLTWPNIL